MTFLFVILTTLSSTLAFADSNNMEREFVDFLSNNSENILLEWEL